LEDCEFVSDGDSRSSPREKETLESLEEGLPCDGDLLMVRSLLDSQSVELEKYQRENIFYTRCKVFENNYSLIVDNDACCNCCSSMLVDKLSLIVISIQKPYKLQWIKDDDGIVFNQQFSIEISIGKHKDEVLCNIFFVEAKHILLGNHDNI